MCHAHEGDESARMLAMVIWRASILRSVRCCEPSGGICLPLLCPGRLNSTASVGSGRPHHVVPNPLPHLSHFVTYLEILAGADEVRIALVILRPVAQGIPVPGLPQVRCRQIFLARPNFKGPIHIFLLR